MPRKDRLADVGFWCALATLILAVTGCGPVESPDRSASVQVDPGPSWTRTDSNSILVPGRCVAAWTGPEGSSLVVVRSLPIPRGNAAGLGLELSTRLENLPGLKIVKLAKATVASQAAARVEVVAPGFGDSLAPSGLGKPVSPNGRPLVPTRRVSVGFARTDGTYWVVCHYPESAVAQLGPEVDTILKSGITVRDRPAGSSSY